VEDLTTREVNELREKIDFELLEANLKRGLTELLDGAGVVSVNIQSSGAVVQLQGVVGSEDDRRRTEKFVRSEIDSFIGDSSRAALVTVENNVAVKDFNADEDKLNERMDELLTDDELE
jgi:bifunctional ADP-heptose synthase (sugar kinase/adenylyltransferase)